MALAPCGPQQPAIPVGFGRRPERPLFPAPRAARVPRADGADHGRHDISVAVVGAGPVGLLTALALARRGYRKVRVLDRLPQPPGPEEEVWGDPDRSYNLGLGGRGQRALLRFGAMEVVERFSRTVVGRKDWSSEGEPKITMNNRRFMTKVIARDRLSSCLYQELREKYPEVEVQFSTECTAVDFHHDTAKLQLQRCGPPLATEGLAQEESCDVTTESVKEMEEPAVRWAQRHSAGKFCHGDGRNLTWLPEETFDHVVSYASIYHLEKDEQCSVGIQLVRKLKIGGRAFLGWNHGPVIVEALPNVEGNLLGVVLFRPTDERIEGLKSGAEAKKVFEELFPDWPTPMITDQEWENFAARKTRQLPQFAYTGPELNLGGKCCLLGDAIHSVKPFFGLGLNSGFEDISVLDQCLEDCNSDLSKALPLYTRRRAEEAKCLVQCQRRFDQATDLRFALAFVLPIVLDTIFRKLLPSVFAPGLLALFQDGELTFTAAKRRKQRDRILQTIIILAFLTLLCCGSFWALRGVTKFLWRCLAPPVHGWLHHELM